MKAKINSPLFFIEESKNKPITFYSRKCKKRFKENKVAKEIRSLNSIPDYSNNSIIFIRFQ